MSGFAIWPPPTSTVSPATLAREMMALGQATLSPPAFPDDAARGTGQPVIVVPGFLAPDMPTGRLRDFLLRQNFASMAWTGGINLGPMRRVMAALRDQICETAAQAAALLWDAEEVRNLAAIAEPPPVPLTAIISRDDGIIERAASWPDAHAQVEVVEVGGAHMSICTSPEVQRIIADRLARA